MKQEEGGTPLIPVLDRSYWEGTRVRKLLFQRCSDCGKPQFFPRPLCCHCWSTNLTWEESQGKGRIYSFTFVWTPRNKVYRKRIEETGQAIAFAEVTMDEGFSLFGVILDSAPQEIEIGKQVHAAFEQIEAIELCRPSFRLS